MYLVRLIYASKTLPGIDGDCIEDILNTARRQNKSDDISGLLCFNRHYFLQCLEGSRSRVNATYQRILRDSRHSDAVMLAYSEIPERAFPEWTMGYVPEGRVTRESIMRYTGSGEFNPYSMSGESAHRLLLALKAKAAAG